MIPRPGGQVRPIDSVPVPEEKPAKAIGTDRGCEEPALTVTLELPEPMAVPAW